ncbi:MAG: hypothetical protein QM790_16195 [Nibricoccus sp.]
MPTSNSEREMELANFVCKFREKNLLDYIDYFAAAMRSPGVRKWGSTTYLLQGVEFKQITSDGVTFTVCFGRIVKQMVLRREQILVRGVLKAAPGHLDTAPSAIFAIVLENHRLLYTPETQYAPNIHEFAHALKTIVRNHIRQAEQTLREERQALKKAGVPVEKIPPEEWAAKFPVVDIRATPIASNDSIAAFLGRFSVLKTLQIKLLETNHEVDYEQMWGGVRDASNSVGSQSTEVMFKNKAEGLNTDAAQQQISGVANQGNHEVNLSGTDRRGAVLKGNNEHMRFRTVINLTKDIAADAASMVGKFVSLLKDGTVAVQEFPVIAAQKLNVLLHPPTPTPAPAPKPEAPSQESRDDA